MKGYHLLYICNLLDDRTKAVRKITTDSPAATNKVLGVCRALQKTGVNVNVVSLGRGRQQGSGEYFASSGRQVEGVRVVYASFWDFPLVTHFVSALSLLFLVIRRIKRKGLVVVAYNRTWHYIPALFVARILRAPCYLDLEDGYIGRPGISQQMLKCYYDWACNCGSVLACNALKQQVKTCRNLVCYGVAEKRGYPRKNWQDNPLLVLWGGTLKRDMGAGLFISAVRLLKLNHPHLQDKLHFVVTGRGDMAEEIECFAHNEVVGWIDFYGSLPKDKFDEIRSMAHVGLSLNLPSTGLNETVFPSKVMELATNGLLVIATRTSDIPEIFTEQDALLLADETPESLVNTLCWAVKHREDVGLMAKRGRDIVLGKCSLGQVVGDLFKFFWSD